MSQPLRCEISAGSGVGCSRITDRHAFCSKPGYIPGELVMSAVLLNWWYTFRMLLQTNRIASAALEESWLQVRSKAAILSAAERAEYLRTQAASVVQQHVDKLVRENPAIPDV